ncbi:hypothetical protein ACJX0J_035168, partial [Zea mays]
QDNLHIVWSKSNEPNEIVIKQPYKCEGGAIILMGNQGFMFSLDIFGTTIFGQ